MAGKLDRFSKQSGTLADHLATAREDYTRMERIADALAGALRGVIKVADRDTDEFNHARALLAKYKELK